MSDDIFQGFPIWDTINKSPESARFAFYNGFGWTIAKANYREIVIQERMNEQGVKGLLSSTNGQTDFAKTKWFGASINFWILRFEAFVKIGPKN